MIELLPINLKVCLLKLIIIEFIFKIKWINNNQLKKSNQIFLKASKIFIAILKT